MTQNESIVVGLFFGAVMLGAVLKMDEMDKERERRKKVKENQR